MLNTSVADLNKMFESLNSDMVRIGFEIGRVDSEISVLSKKRQELGKTLIRIQTKAEAVTKARIVVKGIPKDVAETRRRLLVKMEKAKREDITIATKKELDFDIISLQNRLRQECSHPFVYDRPGYRGDRINEFENRHPGRRYCIVCGFSEETYKWREAGTPGLQIEWIFERLVAARDRIILSEPYRPYPEHRNKDIEIWVPLAVLLHPIETDIAKALNS